MCNLEELLERLVAAKLAYDSACAAVGHGGATFTVKGPDGKYYMVTMYEFGPPDVRGPVVRLG